MSEDWLNAGGMAGLLEAVQRMVGGKADREEVHGLRRLLADKVNVADHQVISSPQLSLAVHMDKILLLPTLCVIGLPVSGLNGGALYSSGLLGAIVANSKSSNTLLLCSENCLLRNESFAKCLSGAHALALWCRLPMKTWKDQC